MGYVSFAEGFNLGQLYIRPHAGHDRPITG